MFYWANILLAPNITSVLLIKVICFRPNNYNNRHRRHLDKVCRRLQQSLRETGCFNTYDTCKCMFPTEGRYTNKWSSHNGSRGAREME